MSAALRAALSGLKVVEIGGGAAGAYCGRLLVDAGATVAVAAGHESRRREGIVRAPLASEEAFAGWLGAGKRIEPAIQDPAGLAARCAEADLVVLGEDSGVEPGGLHPRLALIDISWFGRRGAYQGWQGSDLVISALSGMPQMVGDPAGPPLQAGDRHATTFGGITAYIAACAALLAPSRPVHRLLEVSILESVLVLSEMHMHFFERDGLSMRRCGWNRFAPNGPVGIYPCREGWIGITITTPDQWRALCAALELREQAADEGLVTRELRFERLDEVEAAVVRALAARSALEWAAVGRAHRIPMVVVPDAQGIREHPVFAARESIASFEHHGRRLEAPRTPFALTRTPVRQRLDAPMPVAQDDAFSLEASVPAGDLLAGITVVDFAMGWAGPLASRLLADLGAKVLKIEAGRYPDWWRGVNWTPEYIEQRLYENAKGYCALNRGKLGVSLDLTSARGRELALALIAGADAVVENQAAGVMDKLGLGYEALAAVRPDLVMTSMSAFGTGNAWSDTRAYGSTLEQGCGLPSFNGLPGAAPMMFHLAFGDPVGGLYGCAATLTALIARRRSGQGQYVNLSMVEAMLQFAAPALLEHQVAPGELRRGNRHVAFAPQGIYPAAGADRWLALSVTDAQAFERLARHLGREDWLAEANWRELAFRQQHADALDAAISAWSARRDAAQAASALQALGIAAAPIVHAQELPQDAQLQAAGFFIELQREFSGPQRQCGIAILSDGRRLGSLLPAPLLGEHSAAVLAAHAGIDAAGFDQLVADTVVSFAPKPTRNQVLPTAAAR